MLEGSSLFEGPNQAHHLQVMKKNQCEIYGAYPHSLFYWTPGPIFIVLEAQGVQTQSK